MKKYFILLLCMICTSASCCPVAYAEPDSRTDVQINTAAFDESSVLAVVKTGGEVGLFSTAHSLEKLGISEVENLDEGYSDNVSLHSDSQTTALRLTLSEPGRDHVLETVENLNKLPYVEYAEPNYIYTLADQPNDMYYVQGEQYALDKIGAPAVWDLNINCEETAVAVLDSGIMMDHPDLIDNIWTNPDEIPGNRFDDDGNGLIDDIHGWNFCDNNSDLSDANGHGTHVSGIISASTNNEIGVASLARNAKIIPLKIFGADRTTTGDLIYRALRYVMDKDIPIVNNSYTGENSTLIYNTIRNCKRSVFVAAAGNDSSNNDVAPCYPASYNCSNIISVASTDQNDNLSTFSNYGAESVDIAAPGTRIISTYVKDGTAVCAYIGGTSMACPMTAGTAAVMKAKHPDMTPEQIIKKIKDSTDVIDGLNKRVITSGRLNAYQAVLLPAETVTLDQTAITMEKGDTVSLNETVYPADTTDTALWQSSDTNVAIVKNRTITAVGCGTATITVTYGTAAATCEVTVTKTDVPVMPSAYNIQYTAPNAMVASPDAGTYCVIFAAYRNDILISIEAVPIVFTEPDWQPAVPQHFDTNGADQIKVMLWRSIEDMRPLCAYDTQSGLKR